MKQPINFKVGDSVIVRPNVQDPDLEVDIGGWQGRISEFHQETNMLTIDWDSVTLKNMPSSVIDECEEQGLDCGKMGLEPTDVELSNPRDTAADVAEIINKLQAGQSLNL